MSKPSNPAPDTKNIPGYDKDYYSILEPSEGGSRLSAEIIVPLVLDLLKPASIIDLGCGLGSWLSVFQENGVDDILGIDLPNVDRDLLLIPKEKFQPFDLRERFRLDRTFALSMCHEVVGHLTEKTVDAFMDDLVALAPISLFSAPVPHQGGPNQVLLHWPQYWVEKFAARGFRVLDPFREKIWDNPDVKWWFCQNLLLFVREDVLAANETLQHAAAATRLSQLALVHPRLYLQTVARIDAGLVDTLREIPRLSVEAIKRRLG